MASIRVRSRVTTTHQVEAYGGFQFGPGMMQQIAMAIQAGDMPMHYDHDISRPVHARNIEAGVEKLDDGHLAVWVEFDVERAEWEAREAARIAAGAPGGFSISLTAPINQGAPRLAMAIAADASHFADEAIVAASETLSRFGPVEPSWLFQFSFVPEAKVVIDLLLEAVGAIGPDLVASTLYDAAKGFIRPGRGGTTFNIVVRRTPRGRHTVKVHLSTDDPAVLRDALAQLPPILTSATEATFAFDSDSKRFKSIAGPGEVLQEGLD